MTAVPDSHDFTSGAGTTSEMNAYVRDPIRFLLNRPMAMLRQAVAQSLSDSTWTSITFDTEDLDTDPTSTGGHSTSVNTSRYTANYAGWYQVSGLVSFAANTTGQRGGRFAVNGSAVNAGGPFLQSTSANNASLPVPALLVFLNVSDYVELQGWQGSGAPLNTFATATAQSAFSIQWVRNA